MIAKNNYAWLPQHRTARNSPGKKIFQIQVALLGTSPPIWRRLQVPAEIRLADLHEVLQVAMGWTDYHMHAFRCRGKWYGSTDPEQGGPEMIDESEVQLAEVLVRHDVPIVYIYDLGDSWHHGVKLEKRLPFDPHLAYPVCTDGEGACPPEDCGGIPGFYGLLEAIRNPQEPHNKEILEWKGKGYHPKAFSIEAINQRLPGRRMRVSESSH